MNIILDPSFHMWFVLALTGVSVIAFIREEVPLEITSVGILTVLLLVGQLFPLLDAEGNNHLNAASLLAGFANPSLIAVLALLVMGQGMIHTDALRIVTNIFAINKGQYDDLDSPSMIIFNSDEDDNDDVDKHDASTSYTYW